MKRILICTIALALSACATTAKRCNSKTQYAVNGQCAKRMLPPTPNGADRRLIPSRYSLEDRIQSLEEEQFFQGMDQDEFNSLHHLP